MVDHELVAVLRVEHLKRGVAGNRTRHILRDCRVALNRRAVHAVFVVVKVIRAVRRRCCFARVRSVLIRIRDRQRVRRLRPGARELDVVVRHFKLAVRNGHAAVGRGRPATERPVRNAHISRNFDLCADGLHAAHAAEIRCALRNGSGVFVRHQELVLLEYRREGGVLIEPVAILNIAVDLIGRQHAVRGGNQLGAVAAAGIPANELPCAAARNRRIVAAHAAGRHADIGVRGAGQRACGGRVHNICNGNGLFLPLGVDAIRAVQVQTHADGSAGGDRLAACAAERPAVELIAGGGGKARLSDGKDRVLAVVGDVLNDLLLPVQTAARRIVGVIGKRHGAGLVAPDRVQHHIALDLQLVGRVIDHARAVLHRVPVQEHLAVVRERVALHDRFRGHVICGFIRHAIFRPVVGKVGHAVTLVRPSCHEGDRTGDRGAEHIRRAVVIPAKEVLLRICAAKCFRHVRCRGQAALIDPIAVGDRAGPNRVALIARLRFDLERDGRVLWRPPARVDDHVRRRHGLVGKFDRGSGVGDLLREEPARELVGIRYPRGAGRRKVLPAQGGFVLDRLLLRLRAVVHERQLVGVAGIVEVNNAVMIPSIPASRYPCCLVSINYSILTKTGVRFLFGEALQRNEVLRLGNVIVFRLHRFVNLVGCSVISCSCFAIQHFDAVIHRPLAIGRVIFVECHVRSRHDVDVNQHIAIYVIIRCFPANPVAITGDRKVVANIRLVFCVDRFNDSIAVLKCQRIPVAREIRVHHGGAVARDRQTLVIFLEREVAAEAVVKDIRRPLIVRQHDLHA